VREALYLVKFGDAAASGYPNGGVLVMVGGRLFGGDSGFYYRGTVSHEGDAIAATIEMTRHDPKWHSAFGEPSRSFAIKITGQILGPNVVGKMERVGTGLTVPMELLWAADMPNRSDQMQTKKAMQQLAALAA
jgi:T3SS negative regulator,GrlR